MATIAAATISGVTAIIVCVITQLAMMSKQTTEIKGELKLQTALIDERIKVLSDRVDKHNNLVERTYKLEERTEIQEEKIREANLRIEDLKNAQA